MKNNVKKIVSSTLTLLLLAVCAFAFNGIQAEAADITIQEVEAIILEGNRDFYEYTSLELFDPSYLAIPKESEQVRAGYEAKVRELTDGLDDDMEKAQAIHK